MILTDEILSRINFTYAINLTGEADYYFKSIAETISNLLYNKKEKIKIYYYDKLDRFSIGYVDSFIKADYKNKLLWLNITFDNDNFIKNNSGLIDNLVQGYFTICPKFYYKENKLFHFYISDNTLISETFDVYFDGLIYNYDIIKEQLDKERFKELLRTKSFRVELNPTFKNTALISEYTNIDLKNTIGYIKNIYFNDRERKISLTIVFDADESVFAIGYLIPELKSGLSKITIRALGDPRTGKVTLIGFDIVTKEERR